MNTDSVLNCMSDSKFRQYINDVFQIKVSRCYVFTLGWLTGSFTPLLLMNTAPINYLPSTGKNQGMCKVWGKLSHYKTRIAVCSRSWSHTHCRLTWGCPSTYVWSVSASQTFFPVYISQARWSENEWKVTSRRLQELLENYGMLRWSHAASRAITLLSHLRFEVLL